MPLTISFKGKTVAVTGGASGLGLAIAAELADAGASVLILDRDISTATRVSSELNSLFPGKIDAMQIDVSDPDSVSKVFRRFDDQPLDLLVNSAGIREIQSSVDVSPLDWQKVMNVNLNGSFYCAQQAARRMRYTGGGSIINIASVAGFVAMKKRPAYVTSKHGVVGLTKILAADFAEFGIRVNAVAPGTFRTAMTEKYWEDADFLEGLADVVPLGTGGAPEDVANAVAFLASDLARFITGVVLPVDGGWLASKTYSPRPSAYTRGEN